MSYRVQLQTRAEKELEEASDWYNDKSEKAAINFFAAIEKSVAEIQKQPDRFRKTYKNFRETLLKKYPYTVIYIFDEEKKLIVISSIFHQKRNPKAKYRKLQ